MFGNGEYRKRELITVTPAQAEALNLYARHYDILGALLTLSHMQITDAMARGYVTEGGGSH